MCPKLSNKIVRNYKIELNDTNYDKTLLRNMQKAFYEELRIKLFWTDSRKISSVSDYSSYIFHFLSHLAFIKNLTELIHNSNVNLH